MLGKLIVRRFEGTNQGGLTWGCFRPRSGLFVDNVAYMADQVEGLATLSRGIGEIRVDSPMKILGLTDIEQLPFGVEHPIHARACRNICQSRAGDKTFKTATIAGALLKIEELTACGDPVLGESLQKNAKDFRRHPGIGQGAMLGRIRDAKVGSDRGK